MSDGNGVHSAVPGSKLVLSAWRSKPRVFRLTTRANGYHAVVLKPKPKSAPKDDANLRGRLVRLWRLVELLHQSPRGLPTTQIERRLSVSRATCYRDLNVLKAAGVMLVSETVNGEARHRLEHHGLPALNPTALQMNALRVARTLLVPFEGMRLVREFDALLGNSARSAADLPFSVTHKNSPAASDVVAAVEQALGERRRIYFAYQSPNTDQATKRTIDPISMRAVEGHLYLVGFDVGKQAARTFKLLRMRDVEVSSEPATAHPEVDEEAMFANSVKAWAGDSHEVAVRIPTRLAGVADEWPLVAHQEVQHQGDGTAIVKARVAGLVEAMRWVLRWGSDAEVVGPDELRRLVADELTSALSRYS